jgi:ribosome modulation factor
MRRADRAIARARQAGRAGLAVKLCPWRKRRRFCALREHHSGMHVLQTAAQLGKWHGS